MPHYIALIREQSDGCFEVSFPDLPGIVTGGDDFEDAVEEAAELLEFAAEDWTNPDGSSGFKPPSSLDELRRNPQFVEAEKHATAVLIEFPAAVDAPE
jgi:antitoxin HicB